MTETDMKDIYKQISKEREEMLPRYLEVMSKYFPQKITSDYMYMGDDLRNPQKARFVTLFSSNGMLYGEREIPEAEFILAFENVMYQYSFCKLTIETSGISDYYDSKELVFDHADILITDPCYIIKDQNNQNDWDLCNCGNKLEALGIRTYVTKSTIYGDWECTVWNKDTKEILGNFCADSAQVSIMALDEVKAYNPKIEEWYEEHHWCATIIRDFTGTAQIKIGFEGDKAGEYDFYCYVEGNGSTNFFGGQTGL